MHLNHLLEQTNVDVELLTTHARREGCRGFLVVGGSLADGLGTPLSDVDLMCFEPSAEGFPTEQRVSIVRRRWGSLTVDLHRVAAPSLTEICVPYRRHVLDVPDRPLGRLPYDILVLLHSLHSGIPITDPAEVAGLADAVGADLLPILLGLRGLNSFLLHYRDGRQFIALRLDRPTLVAARSAVEAAADAALAMSGRLNPNSKWRMILLDNAAREARPHLLPWNELAESIMRPAVGDAPSVLRLAASAAGVVAEETELAMYHEGRLVRALAAGLVEGTSSTEAATGGGPAA